MPVDRWQVVPLCRPYDGQRLQDSLRTDRKRRIAEEPPEPVAGNEDKPPDIPQYGTSRDSRKKWDYDFKPLYVVCFLNFNSRIPTQEISQRNEYISKYRYINKETGSELGDGTNIVFVDLHNFTKEIDECNDLKDIWIYSIRNMLEMDKCPDKIIGSEVEELFRRAELAKMTLKQRIILEESIMTQNDILNSVAEQLEEARAKERKHIIRLLLESGISPEKIADMLKMEVEDVKTANDLD
ncbi:MAG: PD-(D/E)XK nuclease family transposase [Bacteroidales bacterium]|nr:PD-(D/E)XK nuclease family transposase [Bacteroidales bacterium]